MTPHAAAVRRGGVAAAVVAVAMVAAALGQGWGTASSGAAETLPRLGRLLPVVSTGDLGDPYVVRIPQGQRSGFRYVVYATANWDQRVPTAVSDDLRSWRPGPDALPALPRWAQPDPGLRNAWAPSVLVVREHYVMYYATKARVGMQCISVATAADPLGPFVDRSTGPLVCQRALGGAIDPSPIRLGGNRLALVWKSDGRPHSSTPPVLWGQRLRPDGLALVGSRHRLLTSAETWQDGVIEGPAMVDVHGAWWLFYSGNSFRGHRYAIGAAACDGPLGPCREVTHRPILATRPGLLSPGGLEAFTDDWGRLWAVFHTWRLPTDPDPYSRAIHLAPLT